MQTLLQSFKALQCSNDLLITAMGVRKARQGAFAFFLNFWKEKQLNYENHFYKKKLEVFKKVLKKYTEDFRGLAL